MLLAEGGRESWIAGELKKSRPYRASQDRCGCNVRFLCNWMCKHRHHLQPHVASGQDSEKPKKQHNMLIQESHADVPTKADGKDGSMSIIQQPMAKHR